MINQTQTDDQNPRQPKIWVESDLFGGRHVMVQNESEQPSCHHSFVYDPLRTNNWHIQQAAEDLARALGATDPIECRTRLMPKHT
jgi:hypothetical protein